MRITQVLAVRIRAGSRNWSRFLKRIRVDFISQANHLESESRRRLIYLQQNISAGDPISNTGINNFGSQSLHKKIEIGNISGLVVASSAMGFTIFDLFNEIINIDDMKLGCSH